MPIEAVLSIDEVAGKLDRVQRRPEVARSLALSIKSAIHERVGAALTCSIGIASNKLLAKLASDMQKPDGLVLLRPEDLPEAILHLRLQDISGIGANMHARLNRAGITDMAGLWKADARHLRRIWNGINGLRFHALLHGADLDDGGAGNSSLAIGYAENKPVLAMRWNGTKDDPLGNPQSRGLPTWFVVPDQHWKQMLDTEQFQGIKEDTLNLARNFLDLKRVYFVNRCPNPDCRDYQRLVLHEYRVEQLGDIIDRLKRNTPTDEPPFFYHIICDGWWNPTDEDKAELLGRLQPAWDNYLQAGTSLTARLMDDGTVKARLGDHPESKPQNIAMLKMQLDNSLLTAAQKDEFLKRLAEKRIAVIDLPRKTARISVG